MIKGQVDEFFKLVDFNGDGRVSFEEFKIAVHKGILTNVFGECLGVMRLLFF